jgi:hypothetical protein
LRRTGLYDSLLGVSDALYLGGFEQPESRVLFQYPGKEQSKTPSIPDDLLEIRESLGFAGIDISTLSVTGRHVLVNPVIPADQFGKSFVSKLCVPLGSAYIKAGDDLSNRRTAIGALLQLLLSHGLLELEDLAQGARLHNVFIFIDRHIFPCLPFELIQTH